MYQSLHDIAQRLAAEQPPAAIPLLDKLEITSENRNHWTPIHEIKGQINAINADFERRAAYEKTMRKRANSKHLTTTLAAALLQLPKPHNPKAYANTFACASFVVKEADRLKSKYCKNRWCLVCNRIKTAYLIEKYTPFISKWHDKQFVTLTAPNVKKANLAARIEEHLHVLTKIKDRLRKQGTKIIGIRKLETTYNPDRNDYHPHLHLIIAGELHAKMIVDFWLDYYPDANRDAQDITPATDSSVKELFKYFTKITSDSKKTDTITLPALDAIFEAVKGRRVFQSFGFVGKVVEELTDQQMHELQKQFETERTKTSRLTYADGFSTSDKTGMPAAPSEYGQRDIEILQTSQVYIWNQNAGNWHDSGELLSDYQITGRALEFKHKLVYHEKNIRIAPRQPNHKRNADTNPGFAEICPPVVERIPRPKTDFLHAEKFHDLQT